MAGTKATRTLAIELPATNHFWRVLDSDDLVHALATVCKDMGFAESKDANSFTVSNRQLSFLVAVAGVVLRAEHPERVPEKRLVRKAESEAGGWALVSAIEAATRRLQDLP